MDVVRELEATEKSFAAMAHDALMGKIIVAVFVMMILLLALFIWLSWRP
jgi:hypothetical protein